MYRQPTVGTGLMGLGRRPGHRHSVESLSRRAGAHCADGHGCADDHALSIPKARLVPMVALYLRI
jgi:hypothetical protein